MANRSSRRIRAFAVLGSTLALSGCLLTPPTQVAGTVFGANPFTGVLVQSRTFINGVAVSTVTYATGDPQRTPLGIDFNADGKIDPIVGYGPRVKEGDTQAVVQILLSKGGTGSAEFTSLTLDSKTDWAPLGDVAAADIDGDGYLDLIAGTGRGVVFLRHPPDGDTTDLSSWGSNEAALEYLEGSTELISNDELLAILAQALGPGVNLDNYDVTVEQGYSRLTAGDMDDDGDNDIVASRRLNITLSPKPGSNLQPIMIIDGVVQVFVNPGGAIDGTGWTLLPVGQHERHNRLDRDGASGVMLYDLDNDGDLDIISAAEDDTNAQVVWFENPDAPLNSDQTWQVWRIGSVRNALSIDVGDLTGDGRVDVIATGGKQMQLVLFEQPATGPQREYDWDTYPIVTFDAFEPRDAVIADIDGDSAPEIVLGGSLGAVRYFEMPGDPRTDWSPVRVFDFAVEGEVGLIGYGDLDGDGDLDLLTLVNDDTEQNDLGDELRWIRNERIQAPTATSSLPGILP